MELFGQVFGLPSWKSGELTGEARVNDVALLMDTSKTLCTYLPIIFKNHRQKPGCNCIYIMKVTNDINITCPSCQLPDPSGLKAVEPVLASPTVVDGYLAIPVMPWKFNSEFSPENIPGPKRKGSSSNHHFSGAMLNFGVHCEYSMKYTVLSILMYPKYPWLLDFGHKPSDRKWEIKGHQQKIAGQDFLKERIVVKAPQFFTLNDNVFPLNRKLRLNGVISKPQLVGY